MMKHEGRQMLAVFVGILLVGAPFFDLLTLPVLLAMALIGSWVGLMSMDRVGAPPQWLRVLISFGVVGLLITSYGTIFGLIPGTVMVLLLCMLKLFELRSRRDISLIVFLCLFLTASNFFHSQSFWIAAYMFVVVLYLVSLMVYINDRLHSMRLLQRFSISLKHIAYAIPFMLILFITFPRLPGPLWGLPDDAHSARTGVPDELSPGNISELVGSSSVAFRVKFDGAVPAKQNLYWRGLVLSDFDGKTWRRSDAPFYTYPRVEQEDKSRGIYNYTVTLEPTHQHWLYTLDTPVVYDKMYRMTRELQLYSKTDITSVTRYGVASSIIAQNRSLFDEERIKNLSLPQGYNPKSLAYAQQLARREAGDAGRIVDAALAMFNQQQFYYTLEPPLLGDDAVDDFLFATRRGFCEHYATAFVTLMRAAGVPARVIVGYQGGELNPQDDYMIVRQSEAHAWAEVWVNDKWWRVDPTASVAPDRIERGVQHAGLEIDRLPLLFGSDSELLRGMIYQWDSMQNAWNQWVIGFDADRQKQLFNDFGIEDVKVADLVAWLVAAMTAAGALLAFWLLYLNKPRRDPVEQYYEVFCRKLEKKGLIRTPYEGAAEFEQRVLAAHPDLESAVTGITRLYHAIRYGRRQTRSAQQRFIREVKRFRVV